MAKRKHDEMNDTAIPPPLTTAAAHDASSSPDPNSATFPTRSRPFIASQDRPRCATCVRNGLDCHYAEVKPTKKDQTISKIYSSIFRLEKKIEDVATLIRQQNDPTAEALYKPPGHGDIPVDGGHKSRLSIADVLNNSPDVKKAQINSLFTAVPQSAVTPHFAQEAKQMSFSAHKILQWPAIQALLPDFLQNSELIEDYATKLEAARPPLPFDVPAAGKHLWLDSLPLSVIRGLTEAYFNTFNTSNPILDRSYFYSATLSVAMESGFGYNIESCVLLVVLALGCLAVTAHKEAGFPLFPLQGDIDEDAFAGFVPPDWISVTEEEGGLPSGLRFLNEQRKRFGFLMCGTGLEYVQCHLLAALYYAQAVRVLDHWNMINKAAVGCLMLLNGPKAELINWDAWESDMLARVFWNTLMFESILVQELDVPPSGLADYEDVVPLPKFPSYSSSSLLGTSSGVEDSESNYQYHFLAQAAHRKLLNRARNNVYTYEPDMSQFPSVTLSRELQLQLDLWRSHHPQFIQQDPQNSHSPSSPTRLASHVMSAMLHGRYLVGKHIMRRPFIYKALHTPQEEAIGPDVLDEVRWCLEGALDWPQITGVFERARTAIPIKFGFASQFMGQLLLFKGVEMSSKEEVRDCLPAGWENWVSKLFEYYKEMAPKSPTLARDLYILEALYER
ncbi:hypothetical protein H072_11289 [Dactylellina haptotyla CBS 200.50]|uniref:Xylanolytic transcriptional activator regulatory domain-containing protein n=1 Tax=Dactylellina haptotyla (strain CBS 200.50) TaxID=1284197 RepID=S7ZY56_DACHA|nr:hypothetical protein H072_11289 [Dactylellina haptotyla CBS 200.50]